jgi:hypothetical protein
MTQQVATMSTRRRYARRGLIFLFCAFLVLVPVLDLSSPTSAFASGPCDTIDWGGGGSTPQPPDPDFIGEVLDMTTSAPVQGAEVKIFRCDSSGPTYVGSDYTDATGAFGFDNLQAPEGYYLEVRIGLGPTETSAAYGATSTKGVNLSMEVDG